jgi:hypothetical protein
MISSRLVPKFFLLLLYCDYFLAIDPHPLNHRGLDLGTVGSIGIVRCLALISSHLYRIRVCYGLIASGCYYEYVLMAADLVGI